MFVLTNADDGKPGMYLDMAFKLLAPAITKAAAPPEKLAKADPAWEKYTGKYSDRWGDSEVLIYNGKLVLISPQALDPTASMLTLVPVAEHTFKIDGEGYGALGEPVVFELGPDGKVKRMKVGENYVEPVK